MNGPLLKERRLARGWTQQELAAAVPCALLSIIHYEASRPVRPNRLLAARVAELLDVDVVELTGRPAPPRARVPVAA